MIEGDDHGREETVGSPPCVVERMTGWSSSLCFVVFHWEKETLFSKENSGTSLFHSSFMI